MLVAGMVAIAFVGLAVFLLVSNVDSLSKRFLKGFGFFFAWRKFNRATHPFLGFGICSNQRLVLVEPLF